MPTISIDLTPNQAQRLSAALGASSNAEAIAAIKALLKQRVKDFESRNDSDTAFEAAKAKVDTEFGGF